MSNVSPTDATMEAFNEMKLRKNVQYLAFKITGLTAEEKGQDEEIVVDKSAELGTTWEEMISYLEELNDYRYLVFDLSYASRDGREKKDLIFIHWSPEGAKIRPRMVYASTKESFKQQLLGIKEDFVAHDASDLAFEDIQKELQKYG